MVTSPTLVMMSPCCRPALLAGLLIGLYLRSRREVQAQQ